MWIKAPGSRFRRVRTGTPPSIAETAYISRALRAIPRSCRPTGAISGMPEVGSSGRSRRYDRRRGRRPDHTLVQINLRRTGREEYKLPGMQYGHVEWMGNRGNGIRWIASAFLPGSNSIRVDVPKGRTQRGSDHLWPRPDQDKTARGGPPRFQAGPGRRHYCLANH